MHAPPVIGVLGGTGGVGASTFAAVLAVVAGPSVLVDLDVTGGGVDVVVGLERAAGVRWSGLRVAGGRLDPARLTAQLPRAGGCAVLAADVTGLDPAAVGQVVDVANGVGAVVLDLPRAACPERAAGLARCDLAVIVARCDVGGLVGAHVAASALPDLPVGLVLRRGDTPPDQAAELVGAPLLGVLPQLSGTRLTFDAERLPRAAARVAGGVLSGVAAMRGGLVVSA